MKKKSFITQSHFQIYDKIIPLFRLLCLCALCSIIFWGDGFSFQIKSYIMIIPYFIYGLLLLFSKKVREFIVLKYPYLVGICELIIATYGISVFGGSRSPFYFAYIFMVTFYAIAYNIQYALTVSVFSAVSFIGTLFFIGEKLTLYSVAQTVFLLVFAVFVGSVGGRISKYNIELAIKDPLTSLYNRQYFVGEFYHILEHDKMTKIGFSMIVIDVDDFKTINDKKGHLEGDRILQEIGGLIKKSLNEGDIAARYGGDEFVILLPGMNQESTQLFSKRLEKRICKKFQDKVTISIGQAVFPEDGTDSEELFHCADLAMYKSKARKKAKVQA